MPKLFLKPPVWVFWILISFAHIVGAAWPNAAVAKSQTGAITFDRADLNFTLSPSIPVTGWTPTSLPANALAKRARQGQSETIVAWARLSFDRAQFGEQPLALFTENNREGVVIFLNGTEILRNSEGDNARVMGWNTPYLAPLSAALLRPGRNEIVVREPL